MIPKIIHYCWFGGNPLPTQVKKYIETWKKHLPDYEIRNGTKVILTLILQFGQKRLMLPINMLSFLIMCGLPHYMNMEEYIWIQM